MRGLASCACQENGSALDVSGKKKYDGYMHACGSTKLRRLMCISHSVYIIGDLADSLLNCSASLE